MLSIRSFQLVVFSLFICNRLANGHQSCTTRPLVGEIRTRNCGLQRVQSRGCSGYCPSYSSPRIKGSDFKTTCTCCQVKKKEMKVVFLCGGKESYTIPVAKKCACRPC